MRIPGPDVVAAGGVHLERSEHRVVIRSICEIAVLDRLADHAGGVSPLAGLSMADSRNDPRVQVADLLAGIEAQHCMERRLDLETGEIGLGPAKSGDTVFFDGRILRTTHGPTHRLLIVGAGEVPYLPLEDTTPEKLDQILAELK